MVPSEDAITGLTVQGTSGVAYSPSNWSFGQLAALAGAPAGYLRTLPSAIAADALNYGLQYTRDIEDVGLLLTRAEDASTGRLRAATGPRYGRIWNADITRKLVDQFGDGITGDWRVPGEFGKAVAVTKANTTLYASDRDIFVFLADEENRIEIPNRRNGQSGSMARGFFVWNSEEGSKTFGIGMFLFDYVCCNTPDPWLVWCDQIYAAMQTGSTTLIAAALERPRCHCCGLELKPGEGPFTKKGNHVTCQYGEDP